MIRIGFTPIGGRSWTGGYNYLLNLVAVLRQHARSEIGVVLFFGEDVDPAETAPFSALGAEVVTSALLDRRRKPWSLLRSLLGRDAPLERLFLASHLDVVFESAQFFGWSMKVPALAWIPDFQHRELRQMFGTLGYWKRELGFRAQVLGARTLMLSSEDSRSACEKFYPSTVSRTHVVRFGVQLQPVQLADARRVADGYGLPQSFFLLPNQFWRHKNHMLVLDALTLLRERGKPLVVVSTGQQADPRDPSYFPSFRRAVQERGLEGNFRMLGLVPYAHLGYLMRACDALVNPSRCEGWSTTVEEAKALGVPMLLSDLPVHREQASQFGAVFFDFSAESLAGTLATFRPRAPADRESSMKSAVAAAADRVRAFAGEFVAVAKVASGHAA